MPSAHRTEHQRADIPRSRESLGEAAGSPGAGREHERCVRQLLAAPFAQLRLPLRVETGCVAARRPDAERVRLPPVLEARMLDADRKRGLLDVVQPRCPEELGELSLARARKLRLVLGVRIELARRLPERAERTLSTAVVPDARRHDTALARHASHLPKARDGVGHEVDDELRQGGVECTVVERQLLGRGALHVDPGVPLSRGGDERLRGIDRRHRVGPQPRDELGRERARPGADVEHSLTGGDPREVGQLRGERHRVPAHETVVCVGGDDEAHEDGI